MRTFSVHTPPDLAGDEAAEQARFVKEGFSWPALFVPLLWLLWHRHWVILVAYLVAAGAIVALGSALSEAASAALGAVFALWFAFEANNLRRWALDRRDWAEIGASHGRNRAEAEIRFFSDRDKRRTADLPPARPVASPAPRPNTAAEEPVFGLFPESPR